MGLDMYLTAVKREPIDYSGDYETTNAQGIAQKLNYFPYVSENTGYHPLEYRGVIAYWRKANAVHNWFVKNVQGGVDECQESYVSRKDLEDLLAAVTSILETVELGDPVTEESTFSGTYTTYPDATLDVAKAEELLPSTSGFFFGSTEYNYDYIQDLELTKKQLSGILDNFPDDYHYSFYYQSSW